MSILIHLTNKGQKMSNRAQRVYGRKDDVFFNESWRFKEAMRVLNHEIKQALVAFYNQVESPKPIIMTSMLSTLSSCVQGYVQVKTTYGDIQPVGLITVVVAKSGERKTATDSLVMKPLTEYIKSLQNEQIKHNMELKAKKIAWKIRLSNLRSALTKAIRDGDEEQEKMILKDIEILEQQEPMAYKAAWRMLTDVTAAALFAALDGVNQSVTLHSSDAGSFFTRANMDFISNTNLIWDGKEVTISRVTTGDKLLKSAKLTMSLMIQPTVLERAITRSENVLRDSGFLSRALVTWPVSNQGARFSQHKSENDDSAMSAYYARITELNEESALYQDCEETVTLYFGHEATLILEEFNDQIESRLTDVLAEIPDAASKALNNASRIAALLHMYVYGSESKEIKRDCAVAAVGLMGYYLEEFQNLFGEKPIARLAQEYGDLLLRWSERKHPRGVTLSLSQLLQFGPNAIRKKAKMELAISYLLRANKVRLWVDHSQRGKELYVFPPVDFSNPANTGSIPQTPVLTVGF